MATRNKPGPHRAAADHLADLAGRLTDRDRLLCRLLDEHLVLTTDHIAQLVYGHLQAVQHRLPELTRLRVVDRFRPYTPAGAGSAAYHYVLGEAGAAVLAAEHGVDQQAFGYRRDRALAIAHNGALGHLLGVNGFFAALAAHARAQPDAELVCWWPARRCAERWGAVVRPDAYGRWHEPGDEVDFFVQHTGGSPPAAVAAALATALVGYEELAIGSGIATPVLLWLADPGNEAAVQQCLDSPLVPIATAAPAHGSPAGPVWLPLGSPGPRRRLAKLGDPSAW